MSGKIYKSMVTRSDISFLEIYKATFMNKVKAAMDPSVFFSLNILAQCGFVDWRHHEG